MMLAPLLTNIINILFTAGKFPNAVRQSVIVPLYKKEPVSDINNYDRPTYIYLKCFVEDLRKGCN